MADVLDLFYRAILFLGAALAGSIVVWTVAVTVTREDIRSAQYRVAQSAGGYDDRIRLPVEAFGAHWRIKNFRKNVMFPDGFQDALDRAIEASTAMQRLGRQATITIAPRSYKMTRPVDFSRCCILLQGYGVNSTKLVQQ